ncbi:hypothetical protein HPB48_002067 [Haemaphysalis longicornis]|uniref:Transposase Tc1-like domain-containing protein n=1 Tax=Haemaphysalis longicornis TaxID=44386 RepID=A0A9J6FIC5_HAELO|nr:hypothetical protein HPB48_002067 [Haemaphysalis longicornis]
MQEIKQRDIARLTKRPIKTVNRIIQAYRTERRIKDAPRKPRSRVTSLEEDLKIVAVAAAKPGASLREIRQTAGVQASKTTIKRRLHEAGLKSRIAAQNPLLRVENKEKRLQFARQHMSWTTQNWAKVVFSDECTITTRWDQKARVWRPANSRPLSQPARRNLRVSRRHGPAAKQTDVGPGRSLGKRRKRKESGAPSDVGARKGERLSEATTAELPQGAIHPGSPERQLPVNTGTRQPPLQFFAGARAAPRRNEATSTPVCAAK